MTDTGKKRAIVVPHTHWDREWRYPLWRNRLLLVEFMDELLDTLEAHPEYRSFVTDGQCVLIEDYLQIRPENEPRVRQAIADGRLSIGPWYTLPDLYPIDGECLIRNLLRGLRVSRALGGHLGIGYNSFGWGQTAQFPQIYAGFGFSFAIAAKRVSKERAPACEFLWEAPDGTRLLTTRLGECARANAFFNAYIPIRHGMDYMSDAFRYDWGERTPVTRTADPAQADQDYFAFPGGGGYHPEKVRDAWWAAWDAMDETTVPDCRLLMCGTDFSGALPALPRMIADADAAFDDIEFVHGTLEDYAAVLAERVNRKKLPVVEGEMRDGPASGCSGNALTTRAYLKVANKRAQNALLRRAEPLATLSAMDGAEYPAALLDAAWTHLLRAHPHDSINGVTQDKTAEDTLNRIAQATEIGEVVTDAAVREWLSRIDLSGCDPDDVLLVAVNPLTRPSGGVVKLCLDTPRDREVWDFELVDSEGNKREVQAVQRAERTLPVHDPESRPWPFYADRHTVWADLGELPAGGYEVFRVRPSRHFEREAHWWPNMRTSRGEDIASGPRTLANEHVRVEVAGDGTFALTDRATGRTYAGLHAFEDAGDVGDYWAYYPPGEDQVYTSHGLPARVRLEDNGPLAATIAIELALLLPGRAEAGEVPSRSESRRGAETREMVVTTRLTLRRGARRVDIRTTLTNTVEDHRLRVLLPTDLDLTHADASGHFTVDRRAIEPPRQPDGSFWPEMRTLPMQHFVDVSDGTAGLAVVHDSLVEYAVLPDERHTLAVTLFRAVRNRICTEFRSTGDWRSQNGGQCLRDMEFTYALVPHAGDWAAAEIYAEAEALNAPPLTYQASRVEGGTWPLRRGLLSVEPANLIVSAIKRSEDRAGTYLIRVFNPTGRPIDGRVRTDLDIAAAWLTNLDEAREAELPVGPEDDVHLSVPPGKIVTIEIQPGD